jgi:hypothetical protein
MTRAGSGWPVSGQRIRDTAPANRAHSSVSARSCLRPAVVRW